MRKRCLTDAMLTAGFRRLSGDDGARVTTGYRVIAQDYAAKFSIGPRSLTISVPIGWMHRSAEAFADQFTARVVDLFQQHEQADDACDVPARSPGHVPVHSLGAEGVTNA